ncbi:hypothetical protein BDN72DRAFT_624535 [Pluteus cervinus]|uniref:Uncharacterized protein n=1 Tax=Pluteus cervinus TaxID=181527 RepID=A0ACD3ATZ5_9AGAR|nr:hypothetical protein BDN72DRAFT_624535 [Pluteus cervinus]
MGPLLLVSLFLSLAGTSLAADCKFSTVGSPYSTCYDIATAAKITTAQLTSFNPGLNCNTIVPGQRLCISSGTLPDTTPKPNPDGSCATYTPVAGDYCAIIATKYGITTDKIEQFNKNTYKWKGCAALAVGMPICVSTGTPPPIPVNPNLQCGPESPKNATCPLKACCSAFGFCGLTDEFCKPAAVSFVS